MTTEKGILDFEGPEVYIKVLKGRSSKAKQDVLLLDPATMLIKV